MMRGSRRSCNGSVTRVPTQPPRASTQPPLVTTVLPLPRSHLGDRAIHSARFTLSRYTRPNVDLAAHDASVRSRVDQRDVLRAAVELASRPQAPTSSSTAAPGGWRALQ